MTGQPGPSNRPDLHGQMLSLPPGQWWSPDGWLHLEVVRVGDDCQRHLPEGWVWVAGWLYIGGEQVDWCTVPVRAAALPPPGTQP